MLAASLVYVPAARRIASKKCEAIYQQSAKARQICSSNIRRKSFRDQNAERTSSISICFFLKKENVLAYSCSKLYGNTYNEVIREEEDGRINIKCRKSTWEFIVLFEKKTSGWEKMLLFVLACHLLHFNNGKLFHLNGARHIKIQSVINVS